jgi:hypothetical protein
VNASDRDEFVDEENKDQDTEAGHGSGGGRKSDAGPWKAAQGGGDQTLLDVFGTQFRLWDGKPADAQFPLSISSK